jgi:hypothetical protein
VWRREERNVWKPHDKKVILLGRWKGTGAFAPGPAANVLFAKAIHNAPTGKDGFLVDGKWLKIPIREGWPGDWDLLARRRAFVTP